MDESPHTSLLPVQDPGFALPVNDDQFQAALLGPVRGPGWDRGKMIQRVVTGMKIELSTIPLYLYAMYSVKPTPKGIQVRATLRAVLQQEMLHLALVGNLLSALGGSLNLYKSGIVPQFPKEILYTNIPMNLRALDKESLDHFMKIESASDVSSDCATILAPTYSSVGALYEDLITGVRALPDECLANNPDKQFDGNDFFGDQLIVITDQATALRALRTIIEQGEGNLRVEHSHYEVFSKLYSEPEPVSWDVYDVPDNPNTAGYKDEDYIYKLSLAFDAAYCYLLQTIQRVWQTSENPVRRVLFRNIHSIMSNVLTPLAEILVQQDRKDDIGGVAAPCFNYYAMTGAVGATVLTPSRVPLDPKELHEQLKNRTKDAVDAANVDQQRFTLERIYRHIDENIKPFE